MDVIKECEPMLKEQIKKISKPVQRVSFLKRTETAGRDFIPSTRTIGQRIGDYVRPMPQFKKKANNNVVSPPVN